MSTVDAPEAAVLAPKAPTSAANVAVADRAGAVLRSPVLWLVLLAVGLVARCRQYFGCPSFWYDEAYLLVNIYDCSFA